MNNRQRALAILNYQSYDRLPLVHFGFWNETLDKWASEGHVTWEEAKAWGDGNETDTAIAGRLGFDYNWSSTFNWGNQLHPFFETKVLKVHPDGAREEMDQHGVIVLKKDDAISIPPEIEHTLKDRKSWEEQYLPRLQWSMDRIDFDNLVNMPAPEDRDRPLGIWCGSMLGTIRDWVGLVGLSYLMMDDPALVVEMIDTLGQLEYQGVKAILERYDQFDFAHFWEDICYKAGPLVGPTFFHEKIGPHYRRITELVNAHHIHIVSLDCDGKIDKLIPTWIENGVNTMFPIEVGTWNASIAPWRERFGKELRGVGGMNKVVFAHDYAAIDAEVERLKPLVDLGGFIPCVDHRIAPDARWENVQYYCEKMRKAFG
jgi:hypothetical protein